MTKKRRRPGGQVSRPPSVSVRRFEPGADNSVPDDENERRRAATKNDRISPGRVSFESALRDEWRERVQTDYGYIKRDLIRMVSIGSFCVAALLVTWFVLEVL